MIYIDLFDFSPQATEKGALSTEPTVTVREARESKSHKSFQIEQIKHNKKICMIYIDLFDFSPQATR